MLLAVVLTLGVLPADAVKAGSLDYTDKNGVCYHFWTDSDTSRANVTGYTGDKTEVVIPEKIGEHRVYQINMNAFEGNTGITSVTLPGSLNSIKSEAFKNCTNLKEIVFNDTFDWKIRNGETISATTFPLSISAGAFSGCTSLEKVEFPYGVDCNNSEKVFAGSGVKEITVCWTYYTGILGIICGAEKLEVLNIKFRDDGLYKAGINLQFESRPDLPSMPSLREINVYNAESLEGTHGGYFYEEKDGKMREAFTICPNLKNINLYYNETNDAGEVVVHREYGSPSSRTKYYVPYFSQCYGGEVYDSKTYTPVSSDTSVAKIISTGRVNEWEAAGAGTATITYKDMPFTITMHVGAGQAKKNIADAKLTMPLSKAAYTGKEIEPYFYIIDGKTVLEQDKDYTVEVKDNVEIGTGTVTVTGKGDYAGTITKSFEIDPGPVIAKSVVIGKKKSVITVNADKQADGYQIYYSSKKSKGYKKLYSGKKLKAEVSGLKSGMYIKVRTYKKVGKTTYYSEWSAPVQVK